MKYIRKRKLNEDIAYKSPPNIGIDPNLADNVRVYAQNLACISLCLSGSKNLFQGVRKDPLHHKEVLFMFIL